MDRLFGDLGFGELLIILVAGLVIFGPGKLPEIGKTLGSALREFKKASRDLMAEVTDVTRELDKPGRTPARPVAPARPPAAAAPASPAAPAAPTAPPAGGPAPAAAQSGTASAAAAPQPGPAPAPAAGPAAPSRPEQEPDET